jgi:alkylation response protein AidB-like acyl-CoA dehydrogenase
MEGLAAMSISASAEASGQSGLRALDLLYSETEQDLRESLRALLKSRCRPEDVLRRIGTLAGCGSGDDGQPGNPEPYDIGLWHQIAADVGCAGLLVPEKLDGAGASFREAATVAEELGQAVAPVPYIGSAIVATTALLSAGDDAMLRELARGDVTAALAVGFEAVPGAAFPLTARVSGPKPADGRGVTRLRGRNPGVADALAADVLIVPADAVPHGLYVVGAADEGVRRTPVLSLDMTRQLCDIDFHDAPARPLASGAEADRAFQAALSAGAAALASEQLGVAEMCLQMTVAYVKERRQFARPVGSFQGLKHRLADLWVALTQARAAARYAAACLADRDSDAPLAVALAKSYCGDLAVRAAEECVQMHGGIGFTWEHPAHLYLKRAKADSVAFGTSDAHRASLARLADLPDA